MSAITIPLPSRIGSSGGMRSDGTYLGEVGRSFFERAYARNFAYNGLKCYTVDANGSENVVDVTSSSSIQIFPTSGSGNLSVDDAYEFGILKSDYDTGRRFTGFHITVTTAASAGMIFDLQYFNASDAWVSASGVTGLSTFLKSVGDNHISFTLPTDHASIVHTIGSTVTRVYPFRLKITTVGASPVAPIASVCLATLQTPIPTELTTTQSDYNIAQSVSHISTGDFFDHIHVQKPSGIEYLVWSAQVGGGNTSLYWNGSSFVTIPGLTDPSNGLTRQNMQNYTPITLTANAANATGASVLAIEDGGYAEGVLPSATAAALVGLRGVDTVHQWMIGISGGSVVVMEDNVTVYTHATAPAVNGVYRAWFVDNAVRYFIGNTHVYTSSLVPDQAMNGFFRTTSSGTVMNTVKLVQFDGDTQDATPLTIAMQAGATFTQANGTTASTEFPARYKLTFSTPSNWQANTAANSPSGNAGYHITSEKTGTITTAVSIVYVRGLFATGTLALGLDFTTATTFTSIMLKMFDTAEFTQDAVFELVNLDTSASVTATMDRTEATDSGETNSTLSTSLTINANQRLLIRETSGRANQFVGENACLIVS